MKNSINLFLFTCLCFASAAQAASKPRVEILYTYSCDKAELTLRKTGQQYAVRLVYQKSETHTVTITSNSATVKNLKYMFQGGDLSVDDETQSESSLPSGSLAFTGFHYSDGEMYVSEEEETNEAGYTLAIESGILKGQSVVQASDIFWSDWRESDVRNYTCKLKP
jgi:hypothetical protein